MLNRNFAKLEFYGCAYLRNWDNVDYSINSLFKCWKKWTINFLQYNLKCLHASTPGAYYNKV
jgi:hypothetical protein